MTTHLTDIEKDGLEEVFSVLNMDFDEQKTLLDKILTIIKNFFNELL